jgi:hypothetical protein
MVAAVKYPVVETGKGSSYAGLPFFLFGWKPHEVVGRSCKLFVNSIRIELPQQVKSQK